MEDPQTPSRPRPAYGVRTASAEDPLPRRIDDLIDADHRARIIWAFVSGLDLSALYARVKAVEGQPGSPAIDPRILMAVWLYAIIDHQTSARRIADLCATHSAYRWLCGGSRSIITPSRIFIRTTGAGWISNLRCIWQA